MTGIDWDYELKMLTYCVFAAFAFYVVVQGTAIWSSFKSSTLRHSQWDRRWELYDIFLRGGFSLRDADTRSNDIAYHNGVNTKWMMTP